MSRLRRTSWADIALVIMLVAAAAVLYNLFQAKTNAEEEVARLDIRVKAATLDLSDAQKANEAESAVLEIQPKSALAWLILI